MDEEFARQILAELARMSQELSETRAVVARLSTRFDALEAIEGDVNLECPALTLSTPPPGDVVLCLDFGTARSKAFASSPSRMYDLALGTRAGAPGATHSLLSCVFIADDGLVYFGEIAAQKSEVPVQRGYRQRLDSIKAMITNSSPGADLTQQICSRELNPTQYSLSEGDLLTLYLGYLTDIAAMELSDKHSVSRYVRRRITTPVFPKAQQQWADQVLLKHYREAIIVADHYSGRWNDGIDVSDAIRVIRAARRRQGELAAFTEMPIVEPVAAFASRYRNHEPTEDRRQLITIVDAGAGTTDFATFAVYQKAGAGIKMYKVPESVHAIKKAGNEVDRLLANYIMDIVKQQLTGLDNTAVSRIRAGLALQQRRIKEELFTNGRSVFELSDDTHGELVREEFLALPEVKSFGTSLRVGFEDSLRSIRISWFKDFAKHELVVVATGGSAELPMIRELACRDVNLGPLALRCRAVNTVPEWIQKHYPILLRQYPQLAVAIGGCQGELPEAAEQEWTEYEGLRDQGRWSIPPVMKGV